MRRQIELLDVYLKTNITIPEFLDVWLALYFINYLLIKNSFFL